MNDSSDNLFSEAACFSLLIGLSYVLAGDLESADALETLHQRRKAIQWNDPAFLQLSEEMRSGMPELKPGQKESMMPSTDALVYALTARIAEGEEAMAAVLPSMRTAGDRLSKIYSYCNALLAWARTASDLHQQMRDSLDLLQADTASYILPDLPEDPKL